MAECKLVQSGGQYFKCCNAPHVCQPPQCCPGFPIGKSVCFGDGTCVNKTFFTTEMPPQNAPKHPYGFGYGPSYRRRNIPIPMPMPQIPVLKPIQPIQPIIPFLPQQPAPQPAPPTVWQPYQPYQQFYQAPTAEKAEVYPASWTALPTKDPWVKLTSQYKGKLMVSGELPQEVKVLQIFKTPTGLKAQVVVPMQGNPRRSNQAHDPHNAFTADQKKKCAAMYKPGRQLLRPNPCNSSFYPRPWFPYGICP